MKRHLLLILFIFIAIVTTADASVGFRFRRFFVENGLSSNTVRALMQDKFGFLWMGTDEGLNRYDGTGIKTYRYNMQTPNGLGSNYISVLYEDGDTMWIGTDNGVYIYAYDTDSFTPFHVVTGGGVKIKLLINDITCDKEGNIWIATDGQGVFKYHRGKKQLEQYTFSACSGVVYDLLIDSENRVWVATNQKGSCIYWLNKVENKFELFVLTYGHDKQNSRSLVMFEDSEHLLWFGTWDCGLQKVDRYSGQVTTYLHPAHKGGIMHIHTIQEYAPHRLLIGSDDGLSLFNTHTGEHTLFTNDETNPTSLSNRFVYPIIKDREGGVWVGTYYGGVNYVSPGAGQFEGYSASRFFNSISGNVIGRFCEDSYGRIWIASDDGGLNCFLPWEKRFVHYTPDNGSKNALSYHNVHALCADGDNLWIGTYTGGVNVLNMHTSLFKVYTSCPEDVHSLDGSSSYAIYKDREGRIWVATMWGINLYNRKEDNFIRVKDLEALTIDIDQDTKGNLWFSTQGKGIFKYNPEKQVWKNYLYSSTSCSLLSNQVNSTLVDKNGEIWIGTMDGLCRYNANTDNFEHIPLEIPSRNICCIIEDGPSLWLTTTKGLVRYVPGEGCLVFTKSDGLQSDQFLQNSGFKSSDGKIYIGSINGFNAFYPHQIWMNNVCPPVVITGLEIYNKEIAVGENRLPQALNYTKQLELSYKDNVFSLRYASLSYCIPEKNQYAYKLEGFDKDWNYVGLQNKATYTNLPAGTYVFKVKATNNDGVWNDEGTSLKIIIHPPFYQTAGFKFLYIVLTGVLFIFFIRFILKRAERKHLLEIKELNVSKEKEMHEAKIKFFTTIAHEIRTPVSLIIGPLEKIMNSSSQLPVGVCDDLSIINRNSQRLLVLVNQLLDFRKIEQEGIKLNCASQNIYQLLKAVSERFMPFISQRGATLRVEYPDANFKAMVDNEAVTKVVSNLLTNASKYTKDEVVLSCKVQPEQGIFEIRVTDNGIGISEFEQQKVFNLFYQVSENKPGTGIGLSIVKSIVDAHNGCVEIESEVGKGSSFIVTLPIGQANVDVIEVEEFAIVQTTVPCDILAENDIDSEIPKNRPVMLVVDDNEEMLGFLSGCFSDKYHILTAMDGLEALKLLANNEVTLIICDWMMPGMNGIEFCKELRSNQLISHIPFILLTAKTDINSKVEGMDCGADAYIEKPFSVQYLTACIKNLVELRNLLRRKFSQMPLVPLKSIAGNSADENFLTRMNEIIEQNFSNSDLSVDFLAEQLCISRSGLFVKIKTLANITPNELIQVIRLKKAAALLLENRYRINEVSYMVGFNNPSYFTKCFQKQFGMKPGEFVNNQTGK